jgi:hypothetical protein
MKINSKSQKIVIGVLGLPEPSNGSVTTQKPAAQYLYPEHPQQLRDQPLLRPKMAPLNLDLCNVLFVPCTEELIRSDEFDAAYEEVASEGVLN